MAEERECNISSDCNPIDNGVVKVCYEAAIFSDEVFFCDCSPWYGWKGENCDELTGQNIFYFITLLVTAIWAFLLLIAIFRTLYLHFRYGIKKSRFDPVILTGSFIFVGALLILVHALGTMPSMLISDRFEIVLYDILGDDEDFEDVSTNAGKGLGYSLLIGASLAGLASVHIFASWQKIIINASRFSGERKQLIANGTLRAMNVFIFFFLLVVTISTIVDQLAISTLFIAVLAIVLAIVYPIAYLLLRKTFRNLEVIGEEYVKRMVDLIRYCCLVNAIALFTTGIILTIFYSLLIDFDAVLTPGKFNYIVALRDLALLISLGQATVMAWYVNAVANRGYNKTPTSAGIWKGWDSQHQKLISGGTNTNQTK